MNTISLFECLNEIKTKCTIVQKKTLFEFINISEILMSWPLIAYRKTPQTYPGAILLQTKFWILVPGNELRNNRDKASMDRSITQKNKIKYHKKWFFTVSWRRSFVNIFPDAFTANLLKKSFGPRWFRGLPLNYFFINFFK